MATRSRALRTSPAWPVGTIVEALVCITDGNSEVGVWITARPGELGIVLEAHADGTCEVRFSGGQFTTAPNDAALRLWGGKVSTVCSGGPVHPAQEFLGNKV